MLFLTRRFHQLRCPVIQKNHFIRRMLGRKNQQKILTNLTLHVLCWRWYYCCFWSFCYFSLSVTLNHTCIILWMASDFPFQSMCAMLEPTLLCSWRYQFVTFCFHIVLFFKFIFFKYLFLMLHFCCTYFISCSSVTEFHWPDVCHQFFSFFLLISHDWERVCC